jgi:hypothetical protein
VLDSLDCPTPAALPSRENAGFTKGPALVPHPTRLGRQLWLVEPVLAETALVASEPRLEGLPGSAAKRLKSEGGHRNSQNGVSTELSQQYYDLLAEPDCARELVVAFDTGLTAHPVPIPSGMAMPSTTAKAPSLRRRKMIQFEANQQPISWRAVYGSDWELAKKNT